MSDQAGFKAFIGSVHKRIRDEKKRNQEKKERKFGKVHGGHYYLSASDSDDWSDWSYDESMSESMSQSSDDFDFEEKTDKSSIPEHDFGHSMYYSAYPSTKGKTGDDKYVNNLDEVAVQGPCIFVSAYDRPVDKAPWSKHRSYVSSVMESPTFLDIALTVDDMLETTGDHHTFFENVERGPDEEEFYGIPVYHFVMGS